MHACVSMLIEEDKFASSGIERVKFREREREEVSDLYSVGACHEVHHQQPVVGMSLSLIQIKLAKCCGVRTSHLNTPFQDLAPQ